MKHLVATALVAFGFSGSAHAQALVSDYVNQIVPSISTIAQAQYYSNQMGLICADKGASACSCVGKTVYHDAVSGEFTENYRVIIMAFATGADEAILKLPQSIQGERVASVAGQLVANAPRMVEKYYGTECLNDLKNGK